MNFGFLDILLIVTFGCMPIGVPRLRQEVAFWGARRGKESRIALHRRHSPVHTTSPLCEHQRDE
jgi:hypothetical protein